MAEFQTERQAKEYLARRIVAEAERQESPLTEVERKMLYFTESGWTLPDMMKVGDQFDREYDRDEYEQKIGRLVSKIRARDAGENLQHQTAWDDAVVKLCDGDHYLLVLIDAAARGGGSAPSLWSRLRLWLPSSEAPTQRPAGDLMRLLVFVLLVFAVATLIVIIRDFFEHMFR